jgi:kynurenine formamidase
VLEDGHRLGELPLSIFIGPAVVADVAGLDAEAPISWDDLAAVHDSIRSGAILLVRTGWSRYWADEARYRTHPWLTGEAATKIMDGGVRTVGIDALNVDATPVDLSTARFDAHLAILGVGGVIVALREPIVSVLPLKIPGADGAPVRAVAFESRAFSMM